jgi:hypothetical protein
MPPQNGYDRLDEPNYATWYTPLQTAALMSETTHSILGTWESFYVIVGSSAAALTGLQFVVMALVAESERRSSMREVSAFGTPNVVHFCAVLLISAILSAPWHRLSSAGLGIGLAGAAGFVYAMLVIRRARRQTGYRPVWEDWLWHAALPMVAYGTLVIAALELRHHADSSLFVISASAVLLLYVGIHNAWDTVTYIAVAQRDSG